MGFQTFTIKGWGIDAEKLNPTTEAQISFIKKFLPETYEDLEENAKDNGKSVIDFYPEWLEVYDAEGYTGFGPLFAKAIQDNEEDFYPDYFDEVGGSFIIYDERLPWEMSDRVKKMSAADMTAIFRKYLDELDVDVDVGRQCIEYEG